MAPEAVPAEDVFSPEGQNDPRVQRWMTKWSELQAWVFPLRFFCENLKLGEGGAEGRDNEIVREVNDGIEAALDQAREARRPSEDGSVTVVCSRAIRISSRALRDAHG